LVMALIYAFGDCSGAHLNPGVTLSFALRGSFPWKRVGGYWVMQIGGGYAAAELLKSMFATAGRLGVTEPHYGALNALVMESLLSLLLYSVILGTATRFSLIGTNAAIAVGGTIILCGLMAEPVSGASMNPARSLGPALALPALRYTWIYIVGPLVGSVLAVALTCALHAQRDPKEGEAAEGKAKKGSGAWRGERAASGTVQSEEQGRGSESKGHATRAP
ncbi:MAG TPA: aquaporin, partial [Chthonomonadales bacterium]|nr:aquaporin [Chthonomonadales bacterium]